MKIVIPEKIHALCMEEIKNTAFPLFWTSHIIQFIFGFISLYISGYELTSEKCILIFATK